MKKSCRNPKLSLNQQWFDIEMFQMTLHDLANEVEQAAGCSADIRLRFHHYNIFVAWSVSDSVDFDHVGVGSNGHGEDFDAVRPRRIRLRYRPVRRDVRLSVSDDDGDVVDCRSIAARRHEHRLVAQSQRSLRVRCAGYMRYTSQKKIAMCDSKLVISVDLCYKIY